MSVFYQIFYNNEKDNLNRSLGLRLFRCTSSGVKWQPAAFVLDALPDMAMHLFLPARKGH